MHTSHLTRRGLVLALVGALLGLLRLLRGQVLAHRTVEDAIPAVAAASAPRRSVRLPLDVAMLGWALRALVPEYVMQLVLQAADARR